MQIARLIICNYCCRSRSALECILKRTDPSGLIFIVIGSSCLQEGLKHSTNDRIVITVRENGRVSSVWTYRRKTSTNTTNTNRARTATCRAPRHPCLNRFVRRVSCLFTDGAFAQYQNCPNNPEEFNSVSQIDRISRILFPVAFLVFQIFYWNSYDLSNN